MCASASRGGGGGGECLWGGEVLLVEQDVLSQRSLCSWVSFENMVRGRDLDNMSVHQPQRID